MIEGIERLKSYIKASLLIFSLIGTVNVQSSFSVSADIVFAEKPANYFVFYNYIEFQNNTSDTLQMRWKKVEIICSNPGEPGNIWDVGIQDHVNFYNPANFLDFRSIFS